MKKAIDVVKGAAAKKEVLPLLTHLHVYNNRIQAGNGVMSIDAPFPVSGTFTVPTADFISAVDACNSSVPSITISNNKVTIVDNSFKVTLPCAEGYSVQEPEGTKHELTTPLVKAFKQLRRFTGEDASRPWCCGVLMREGMMYATNNVVAASIPSPCFLDNAAIPNNVVDELLRIGEDPTHFSYTGTKVCFYFKDTSWIKFSLLQGEWPDISKYMPNDVVGMLITDDFVRDCERIAKFCPDPNIPVLKLTAEGVETMAGDKGARCTDYSLPDSYFRADALLPVLSMAQVIDFSLYPAPCSFSSTSGLKGVIMGVRP